MIVVFKYFINCSRSTRIIPVNRVEKTDDGVKREFEWDVEDAPKEEKSESKKKGLSDFVQIDKVNAGDAKSDIMLKGPDGNLEATVSVDDKNNLGLESEYVRLQAEKQLAKKVEEQIKSGQPHDKDALEYLLSEETEHYKQYGESFPYLKEVKPSKKSDEGTTAQTGKGEGDWSRDVESTAKALDNINEKELDKTVNSLEIPMKLQDSKGFQEGIARLEQQRKAAVEKGKDVSDIDEAINQYKEKIKNFPSKGQQLSEAYHKAKQDGSNPGLVKAVEELLGKPKAVTPNVEDWSKDVESKPKQDFAFSSHQRGSVRYDEKEILDNLKSNKRTEDINALGYMELQDLLGKVNKQMPKDLIGNHLFDKINAVLVNENGNAVIKLIDKKSGKINDEAFYKFKNLEDAAKTLYEVKENHRKLQLETLASLEEKGKETELTKYAHPEIAKKALEELGIKVPQSLVKAVEDLLGSPQKSNKPLESTPTEAKGQETETTISGKIKNISDRLNNDIWVNSDTKFENNKFISSKGEEYSVQSKPDNSGIFLLVKNKNGETVAQADFKKDNDGIYTVNEIHVDSDKRGHGIGRAIYDYVDNVFGKIEKSISQSKEGKSLWENNEINAEKKIYNLRKKSEPTRSGGPETTTAVLEEGEPTTSVKNAITASERKSRGLDEIEVEARRSFPESFEEGKRLVDSGELDARSLAKELAKKPRALNAEETTALLYDRMRISNEHEAVSQKILEAQEKGNEAAVEALHEKLAQVEMEMALNDEAARKTGYEQGLGLAIRRLLIKKDYSLANQLNQAKIANGGKEIPKEVRLKLEDLTSQLREAENKLDEYEKRITELEAENKLKKESKKSSRKTDEEYKKERKNTIESIKKKWGDAGKQTYSAPPLAPQLIAIAPDVFKLAKSYAEQGVIKLSDVATKVYNDLAAHIQGITEDDVRDMLVGKYDQKKTPPVLDRQQMTMKANVEKLKREINLEKEKLRLKNRTKGEKGIDFFHKWRRFALLALVSRLRCRNKSLKICVSLLCVGFESFSVN